MLVKIDARVASAMHRAKNDKQFSDFLEAELDASLRSLAALNDEIAFRQMQGKVKFLMDLRELIGKSAEIESALEPRNRHL